MLQVTDVLLVIPILRAVRSALSQRPAALFFPAVTFNTVYDVMTYTPNLLNFFYTAFGAYATFGDKAHTFHTIQLLSIISFSPTLRYDSREGQIGICTYNTY